MEEKLNNFLEEFNCPWQYIEKPLDRLQHYFCIAKDGTVGLSLGGDNCLYLGRVDIIPWDVQSLANAIKVVVRNFIKNNEK